VIPNSYFDSFETPKYQAKNPLQRLLIRRFMEGLSSLFDATQPTGSVLEIGCGEGFVSGWLSQRHQGETYVGVDLDGEDIANLRAKFPDVEAHQGSIYELGFLERDFDVIVCAEVLEHLDDPAAALRQMLSKNPKWLVLSVPNEPWFCASNFLRGKNVSRLGNDPGHVNLWGRRGFRRVIEPFVAVERHETAYPWQMVLARPR